MSKFDPDPTRGYLYQQFADFLAEKIESGELSPGQQLPREDAMGMEYGVAGGTVRRALGILREKGLIVTFPAKGTYVARR